MISITVSFYSRLVILALIKMDDTSLTSMSVHEEQEAKEPDVTSSDPNERKLARRLRIQRRLEAIRRLLID